MTLATADSQGLNPLGESALFAAPQKIWSQLQTPHCTGFWAMVYGAMPAADAVVTTPERASQRLQAL
jgi:hypothetical protein